MNTATPAWPARSLPGDKAGARAVARALARTSPPDVDGAAMEHVMPLLKPHAGYVGIYRPLPVEASLGPLLTATWRARVAYVRAAADHSLQFVAWDGVSPWTRDALNMEAPPLDGGVVPDAQVSVVCVPGLAFAPDGRRLGRGAGCYDRTLGRVPHALRVAVTHERCLFESVPVDARDEPVDVVVTALRVHWTGARGRTA